MRALRVLTKCGVQGASRLLNHAHSLTVARMVSLPSQISAFCALAARSPCICSHLRVALRFAQQPTGLTLPSGALRVALGLRPKCQQGTRFPSRLPGFGAQPQSLMPQHFTTSVASVRWTQETRLSPNSGVFQRSEPPEGAWHPGKVMVSEGMGPILHSFASKTECRISEIPRCKQPESAGIRPSQTG